MKKIAGWIALSTLLSYLCSMAGWLPLAVPTALAWLANGVMWPMIGISGQRQSALLMFLGALALTFALTQGEWLPWSDILAVNLPLLAMFVAVSFLTLANVENAQNSLPKGVKAMIHTAIGVHILGSVINLSVLFIFGDRLSRHGKLAAAQQIILARCFSAAAFWSPFFVAMGVALTYAPGLRISAIIIPGLSLAIIAIALTLLETHFSYYAARKYREETNKPNTIIEREIIGEGNPNVNDAGKNHNIDEMFEGYPTRFESLVMPVALAASVLIAHAILPKISILVLICLFSPVGAMIFMSLNRTADGARQGLDMRKVRDFIQIKLANIASQFAIFLAAGIFSAGIKAIILLYPTLFNLTAFSFNGWMFSVMLALMIVAGMIGIHPVVSVSVVAPLLLSLHPDPTRLALLYLSAWAISTGSGPLTGVGMALISRYQASAMEIFLNNWRYASVMWLIVSLVNAWILPVS